MQYLKSYKKKKKKKNSASSSPNFYFFLLTNEIEKLQRHAYGLGNDI
jgi:hypothetical protein